MPKTMRSFEAKEETYSKFKSLMASQGVHVGDKINELIEEFIIKYGDGDGTSTLDQFVGNLEMRVAPALFDSDEKWFKHIELQKGNEKYLQEIIWKCQTIGARSQNMKDHGMVSVRRH